MRISDLPDINDSEQEWEAIERSAQWKFLQISRNEYTTMYREILRKAVGAALTGPAGEAEPEEAGEEIPEGDE